MSSGHIHPTTAGFTNVPRLLVVTTSCTTPHISEFNTRTQDQNLRFQRAGGPGRGLRTDEVEWRALYTTTQSSTRRIRPKLPASTLGNLDSTTTEDEYLVCREGVASSTCPVAKSTVRGEAGSVVEYLQKLCSNERDVPVGGMVPTGMRNEKGGLRERLPALPGVM